jgi:hypothetical protein
MYQDLEGLEAILVREGETLEQLNNVQWVAAAVEIQPHDELSSKWISLKSEVMAVSRDIQLTNQTNARLIQNGQQLCEVLFKAICPPQTYSPSLALTSRPMESTFEAQY